MELECGVWDSEEGGYIMHTKSFSEWFEPGPSGLRPYDEDGEVAHWRLELTLNDIGRAFLQLNRYLEG